VKTVEQKWLFKNWVSHVVEAAYKEPCTAVRMSFLPCVIPAEQDETQERIESMEVDHPPFPSVGKSKDVLMPNSDILHLSTKWR
jgi:hypothetical protein